jgi:hypothetical protein
MLKYHCGICTSLHALAAQIQRSGMGCGLGFQMMPANASANTICSEYTVTNFYFGSQDTATLWERQHNAFNATIAVAIHAKLVANIMSPILTPTQLSPLIMEAGCTGTAADHNLLLSVLPTPLPCEHKSVPTNTL